MRKRFFAAEEQWSYNDVHDLDLKTVKALFFTSDLVPKEVLKYLDPDIAEMAKKKEVLTIMSRLTSL